MSFTESLGQLIEDSGPGLVAKHETWERIPLGEVADLLNGFAFPSSDFDAAEGTPLLRIRDVLGSATVTNVKGNYGATYLVEPGSLLIGMDGDFNSALWKGPKALLNQRVCKITPDEAVFDLKFLSFALPGYLDLINRHTSSVTVKHLSSRTVTEIPLPLPPLREQRRIVDEIEAQFTRLDSAVESLKRAKANLQRYRASVLKAACEGHLVPTEAELAREEGREYETGEALLQRILKERQARWEVDELAKMEAKGKPPKDDKWKSRYKVPRRPDTSDLPELSEGWVWGSVDQLSRPSKTPTYGVIKLGDHVNEGVPTLRSSNVRNLWLEDDFVKKVSEEISSTYSRTLLEGGELLITVRGTLGGVVVAPEHCRGFNVSREVAVIGFAPEHDAHFTAALVASPIIEGWLKKRTRGVAYTGINLSTLSELPLPIAPQPEQSRIVSEISRRLATIQAIDRSISHQIARSSLARQAILKRAFEGKLVPQDPHDEPASVLLERIKAERDASEPTRPKQGRRKAAVAG